MLFSVAPMLAVRSIIASAPMRTDVRVKCVNGRDGPSLCETPRHLRSTRISRSVIVQSRKNHENRLSTRRYGIAKRVFTQARPKAVVNLVTIVEASSTETGIAPGQAAQPAFNAQQAAPALRFVGCYSRTEGIFPPIDIWLSMKLAKARALALACRPVGKIAHASTGGNDQSTSTGLTILVFNSGEKSIQTRWQGRGRKARTLEHPPQYLNELDHRC